MRSRHLEIIFPNLKRTGYKIDSEQDDGYNCIAWAAGDDENWWDPSPSYYWPRESSSESIDEFIHVFQSLGFEICDNPDLEPDYEKVVIYVVPDGSPQHMARQLPSGKWTSKCANFEDITHTLEGLEGDLYGKVEIVMKRPRFSKSLESDSRMK